MDRKITFKSHITQLIGKAKRGVTFIIRNSSHFKDIKTFLILYFALIRSNLEFGLLIWDPHSITLSNSLESI